MTGSSTYKILILPKFGTEIESHGGGVINIWKCARALSERGHKVVVAAPDDPEEWSLNRTFNFSGRQLERGDTSAFLTLLKSEKPDVVHCVSGYSAELVQTAKREGIPVVMECHLQGFRTLNFFKRLLRSQMRGYRNALRISAAVRSATIVLTPSNFARTELTGKFHTNDATTLTLRNGLDHDLFFHSNTKRDEGLVVAGGRLVADKGVDRAVRVFARLKERGAANRLVIVGEGVERENLVQLVSDLNLGNSVEFLGSLSQRNLATLYQRARALLVTSNSENYSNALVEAMACGCLVSAFDVGGNREIVKDSRFGVLAEPFKLDEMSAKLSDLLSDSEASSELSEFVSEHSLRTHSWALRASELESIYLEALEVNL